LGGDVELTDEREDYIRGKHSDILETGFQLVAGALATPDEVRLRLDGSRIFVRWYDGVKNGKWAVVAVLQQAEPERNWIVTAHLARRLPRGVTEWVRS
jgi:hypothetical protein